MPARLKIFFDGGCRPNPGAMEIAVVARGAVRLHTDLGEGSSMDAEWHALIAAARLAIALELRRDGYVLLGDAVAVIAQANGTQPCRGSGETHRATLLALGNGRVPPIRYIKRTQNLAGIALSRHHQR
ncbi:ribonuclease HI [Sphingomonas sp. PAMC 26617]|uniref:ribonuclease HI n=1 Tax=Sphingomonas sp. PAMC 26617 TaxID=1112216 RepID=UPI000288707B|nr:ribonuclease HI [Sphingomonas sp. PAMC 26617]